MAVVHEWIFSILFEKVTLKNQSQMIAVLKNKHVQTKKMDKVELR